LHGGDASDLVGVAFGLRREVGLDVRVSLDDIAGDIEGVAGSLGNGQAVVEGNAARHGAEADDNAPHLVDSNTTDAAALVDCISGEKRLLEARCNDKRHDTSGKLADTLHGEDRAHHGAAPLGGCEFGCDDGAERVVTTNTNCRCVSAVIDVTFSTCYLLPMRTRQKMMVPTIDIPGESEESACATVEKMIKMSSRPYIFLRPTTSAR
jgi:hypothetical protein